MVTTKHALVLLPLLGLVASGDEVKTSVRDASETHELFLGVKAILIDTEVDTDLIDLQDPTQLAARAAMARYALPVLPSEGAVEAYGKISPDQSAYDLLLVTFAVSGVEPTLGSSDTPAGHVTTVEIQVSRRAILKVTEHGQPLLLQTVATVWTNEYFLVGTIPDRRQQVRDSVGELVDSFVIDYFKANPKK